MRPCAIGRVAPWAVLVVAAGCSYAPDFESGTLQCGPNESCPEGYTCADGSTCWKQGECPTTGAGGPAEKFVGRWTFVSPSTRSIVCNGTAMPVEDVATEYVVVEPGGTAPLLADFFCTWDLDVDPTGTTTVIRAGRTCSGPDVDDATLIYTWRGEAFTLSTTNGKNGTLRMSIPYDYVRPVDTGSCTMTYTATVTRDCQ